MDRLQTFEVSCQGGLISNMDPLQQAKMATGSAVTLRNFEPSEVGGYRKVSGYEKFSSTVVPGSGVVLGVAVFGNTVLAARGSNVYVGSGTSWTAINGSSSRPGAGRYRFVRYNFTGTETVAFCDGTNYPAKWNGTSYTTLNGAPIGTEFLAVFKNHMFFAKGNQLTYSEPASDNAFNAGGGAGQINVGDTITGLYPFRDQLVIFCQNRILRISGDNSTNFVLSPITENLGCLHGDTIREINGDVLFLGPDGLRTISATERIGDFELGSVSQEVRTQIVNLRDRGGDLVAVTVRQKSQYRIFSFETDRAQEVSEGVGAYINNDAYQFFDLMGFKVYCADSYYTDSGAELVVFGNAAGYVYKMESGYSLDGSNIYSVYKTPSFLMDDTHIRKVFHKVHLYLSATGAYEITVNLLLDNETRYTLQPESFTVSADFGDGFRFGDPGAVFGEFVFTTVPYPLFTENLVGAGMSGAFQFTSNDTNPNFTIKSLSIEYGLGGRR